MFSSVIIIICSKSSHFFLSLSLQFWDGASIITRVQVSYNDSACGDPFEWGDERVFEDTRFYLRGKYLFSYLHFSNQRSCSTSAASTCCANSSFQWQLCVKLDP
jgi:hypothetical protein